MPSTITKPSGTKFARIDGVELVSAGKWNASTGPIEIDSDDLAEVVAASKDPSTDGASIKLGHADGRFEDGADGNGQPAYGWVENLRLSSDKKTLIGDLVGIPAKLAEIIPAAFRKRSVEMTYGYRATSGRIYRAVLTGLALLGATPPAVKGLGDVLALYSEQTTGDPDTPHAGAITVELSDTNNVPPPTAAGQHANHETGAGRAPSSKETKVDISKELRDALGIAEDATAEQIREALKTAGLGDLISTPQTEAEKAEAEKAKAEKAKAEKTAAEKTEAEKTEAEKAEAEKAEAEKVAAAAAAEQAVTVTVDAAIFSQMKTDATAGREARAQQITERRDGIIKVALEAGRIMPASAEKYRAMLEVDEAKTADLLESLPVYLSTAPVGHQAGPATISEQAKADDARAARTFI